MAVKKGKKAPGQSGNVTVAGGASPNGPNPPKEPPQKALGIGKMSTSPPPAPAEGATGSSNKDSSQWKRVHRALSLA